MPAATARSWSVRIISSPVRSPTWASRGWEWPPNGRWRIRPSVGPVEDRAPQLELADAVRRLHGVELGHPRVVQELAADHRVAEVDLPRVRRGDVGERRGDAALGHHGVGLAEQRLADEPDVGAGLLGLDRGPQAGPAGADDEDVVRADLRLDRRCEGHRSRARSGSPGR